MEYHTVLVKLYAYENTGSLRIIRRFCKEKSTPRKFDGSYIWIFSLKLMGSYPGILTSVSHVFPRGFMWTNSSGIYMEFKEFSWI